MELMEEVPLEELGASELERLVHGWRTEAGSWFQRRGEAYLPVEDLRVWLLVTESCRDSATVVNRMVDARPCNVFVVLRRVRNSRTIIIIIIIIIYFLAHQHKACRQLKIKQEMTAVGD